MAVPGADRRESTERRRTGRVDSTTLDRPQSGGSPTVSGSDDSNGSVGVRAARRGPFADNTGNREVQVLNGITETDDGLASAPPAIEDIARPTVSAQRSDGTPTRSTCSDANLGEISIYLHCLEPAPDAYRRAANIESRNELHPDGTATVVGPRTTVITK